MKAKQNTKVQQNVLVNLVSVAMIAGLSTGCNKSVDEFSLLADEAAFKQEAVLVAKKIDILWVIDNSGSMETSQNNLASNFNAFINRFETKNYDFRMGVVTTDAWEKRFFGGSTKARLRDGIGGNRSGVYIMTPTTNDLSGVFATNIRQGTAGNGDERSLESFRQGLLEPWNVNFRRPDAFLAVIIVSDEEDFSQTVSGFNESYLNPNLLPVSYFKDFLDTYTNRQTGESANYSVNSITVTDAACRTALSTDGFQRKIATRVTDLSTATGGVVGSLCSNFGDTLDVISDSILALSSIFKLSREPVVESIVVKVDGSVVPQSASNGWTYEAASRSIRFNGAAIPSADADIRISFDPVTIKE